MDKLPLSGVTRRSPLGSGGEDPARTHSRSVYQKALSDGRARLRFRGLWVLPQGSLGGDSNAISSKAAPPPPGERLGQVGH